MTDAEIDALKAGFALDLKVAKACGVECYLSSPIGRRGEIGPQSVVALDENKSAKPFRPSSDWNDAMCAAEKAGLFRGLKYDLCQDSEGDWWVHEFDDHGNPLVMMAPTGPLAICRAILKAVKNAST